MTLLKKNSQIFYSTVKSRFSPILELRKNAQIGKFSFFVKIPKSDFLALICRFWYLMTLLDQGYQKTKKFGFLELKKNSQIFYSMYCKITFFANIRAQKKCSNCKILIFR